MPAITENQRLAAGLLDWLVFNNVLVHFAFTSGERSALQDVAEALDQEVARVISSQHQDKTDDPELAMMVRHYAAYLMELGLSDDREFQADLERWTADDWMRDYCYTTSAESRVRLCRVEILCVSGVAGDGTAAGMALKVAETLTPRFRDSPAIVRYRLSERLLAWDEPLVALSFLCWLDLVGVIQVGNRRARRGADKEAAQVARHARHLLRISLLLQTEASRRAHFEKRPFEPDELARLYERLPADVARALNAALEHHTNGSRQKVCDVLTTPLSRPPETMEEWLAWQRQLQDATDEQAWMDLKQLWKRVARPTCFRSRRSSWLGAMAASEAARRSREEGMAFYNDTGDWDWHKNRRTSPAETGVAQMSLELEMDWDMDLTPRAIYQRSRDFLTTLIRPEETNTDDDCLSEPDLESLIVERYAWSLRTPFTQAPVEHDWRYHNVIAYARWEVANDALDADAEALAIATAFKGLPER